MTIKYEIIKFKRKSIKVTLADELFKLQLQ